MLVQPIQESIQPWLYSQARRSGKSTTALHIAVALLKAGQRVATVDLDSPKKLLPITSRTAVLGLSARGQS